jgi:cell division protein FtsZ
MPDILKFDMPKNQSNIIKVFGVGGGGSNAVTHMFRQGIKDVDFIICNTDAKALEFSPVPTKIQLGVNLTSGLGAGAVPSVGRNAALENSDDIRSVLGKGTKMLFITAGMGGGTGTGAAPVIAQIARGMDILTVGIVTIPFLFEGRKRKLHAEEGIRQLKEHVDALVIISNDRLREQYGNLKLSEAFSQADNVLTTAAKGIAELITVTGYINVDFEDVRTVMKDSGVAIMGTGVAGGENRALKAVEQAISSPLLNNNDIEGASDLLLYIASGKDEITMDEVTEITEFIHAKTKSDAKSSTEVIWGNGIDETLGDKVSVTIIATGFDEEHRKRSQGRVQTVHKYDLYNSPDQQAVTETRKEDPQPVTDPEFCKTTPEPAEKLVQETRIPKSAPPDDQDLFSSVGMNDEFASVPYSKPDTPNEVIFNIEIPQHAPVQVPEPGAIENTYSEPQVKIEEVMAEEGEKPLFKPVSEIIPEKEVESVPGQHDFQRMGDDRIQKLRAMSEKLKNHKPIGDNLHELETVPAYKRRNTQFSDIPSSGESQAGNMIISEDPDKSPEVTKDNRYIHKKVD